LRERASAGLLRDDGSAFESAESSLPLSPSGSALFA
jgi:hypothetical protein